MDVTTKKLTVKEFLALDLPDEPKHHELIDGEVMGVNPPKPRHSNLQALLEKVFGFYELRHPEFEALVEAGLNLGETELFQPDLIVRLDPASGGRCVEEEDCYSGPPEIVVEVLSSRPWTHLVRKRGVYAAAGTPEYWIFSPEEGEVVFLRLAGRDYEEAARLSSGIYESPRLPGWRLDVGAMFRRDLPALAAALQGT